METKKVILLIAGLFLINLVSALPPIPPLPDHFIGDVLIDGQNASVGTQIEIYVVSALESVYSVSEEGKYDLYVTTGETGDLIELKISDILAGTSTRQGGETILLNLSLTTTTTTTPPSSSGSSGGGGGGGSSGGGGSGFISPSTTETSESSSDSEEDVTQEENQEKEEQEEISPGITSAVVGFLGSGKGNIVIAFVIILGIGVMLIKFKPQKWTKRFSH